jgi:hypothetical protein
MKLSKLIQIALLGAAALGVGTGSALAVCTNDGGFAIYQCADLAYFDAPPFAVTFTNDVPDNIEGVFWQIGFGNGTNNTGTGTTGTGNAALKNFNRNDMGIAPLDLVDATLFDTGIPTGATCIRVANWGNSGVDGCCDNNRSTAIQMSDDDILNPYYHVYYYRAFGSYYDGYYNLYWHQDYPMAALLKSLPDEEWFALGAVATVDRGNTGGPGPCTQPAFGGPGTNPAVCDKRPGFYEFKAITNGVANAVVAANNVIPWQPTPRPRAACVAGCSGSGTRTVDFEWDPVVYAHDVSVRASANPGMGIADTANAVGMKDLLRKGTTASTGNKPWSGLVKFDLQVAGVGATDVDPNGDIIYGGLVWSDLITGIVQPTSLITGNPTAVKPGATGVAAPIDTCYRVKVKVGKDSIAVAGGLITNIATCRLGKCGDQGYEVASTHAQAITCIGGALVSEKAINVRAAKAKGQVDVSWEMTTELSLTGFDIIGVDKRGRDRNLMHVNCKQCTSGLGEYYSVTTPKGSLKGANMIRLEVRGGNPSSVQVPIE